VRGETADAGERFRQANEIAFTYGDERATLATLIRRTGPRCLPRLAIGWPQDNASERSAERSRIVEAGWWRWRGSMRGSAGTPSGCTTSSARDSQRWEVGWKL
jgi:hypothetical protein